MKYYVFFHFVNGHTFRATMMIDNLSDQFVGGLANSKFLQFEEDGKLVIVNMSNVTHIKIAKAE